jgi:hypothetical protein
MRTWIFLLSVTLLLVVCLLLVLSFCLELSAQLSRSRDECKKLRTERDWLRIEVGALQKRVSEYKGTSADHGSDHSRAGNDAFASLRALLIKTLHPDGAPQDSPVEMALRSDMFKAVWPEIIKIENKADCWPDITSQRRIDIDYADPVALREFKNLRRPPNWRHGAGHHSDLICSGWRDRRKTAVHG